MKSRGRFAIGPFSQNNSGDHPLMNPTEKDSGKLSLRSSLLVWVTGMALGWGIAFVAAYVIIRNHQPSGLAGMQHAQSSDETLEARSLSAIETAAGSPDAREPVAQPTENKAPAQ
jgi:hypothetical protein